MPPNILWIIAEDMSPDLGFLGTPEVRTPYIDVLANDGMYFSQVFTTSPVCSPSRSALHTGMYQMAIGAHNHRSHRQEDPSTHPFLLPQDVRLLTDWLRDGGYYTGNIKQIDERFSFQGTGKTDWNFTYQGDAFDTNQWQDLIEHQPFYAQINFPETHRGRVWDEAHLNIDRPADPAHVSLPPYYPDHEVIREDWAQYLNTIMSLDRKVGAIRQKLEEDGLAERTIIFFMADHGRAMLRGKQWPYDSGLHVPLIVYWPSGLTPPEEYIPGSASSQLLSSIDITATTLAAAGISKPASMQGAVFWGDSKEAPRRYVFSGRDRGDETVDRIRTLRTKRFRYIKNYYPNQPFLQINRYKEASYPAIWVLRKMHQEGHLDGAAAQLMQPNRPPEELYDLLKDPYELHNLASSPAHQELLMHYRKTLNEWIESINDQGRYPESPAVYSFYEQKMQNNYDERIQRIWKEWGITGAFNP